MKLIAFRITNFRSIVDTNWCPISPDGVTVLVGQNESGKSSILKALACTLGGADVSDDDCRFGSPLPEIRLRLSGTATEIAQSMQDMQDDQFPTLSAYSESCNGEFELRYSWEITVSDEGKRSIQANLELADPGRAQKFFDAAAPQAAGSVDVTAQAPENTDGVEKGQLVKSINSDAIASAIHSAAPSMTLFDQNSGLLPDRVDIIKNKLGKWVVAGDGAAAARNFLRIAEIDLDELVTGDSRVRKHILAKANSRLTSDFVSFWSQTIGRAGRLSLDCDIEQYGGDDTEKLGKPHLTFWISNGFSKLFPKQRSEGVRWFVSFYLQLKATEKVKYSQIFLLDEPGANLHSKAQADVLRLINKLCEKTPVIYSTHSPDLIEYEKLYRVLAVQREGETDDTPTSVMTAHMLGAASRETLSPVLSAMGANLSHQQVIQRQDNVILEEMSALYYLKAFWKLLAETQPAHFIAATGVDNVEPLANMFLGWGLDFIVAVDDDQHGREVFKKLKRLMFGENDELAAENLLKLPECPGIEDAFSKADFAEHVLNKPEFQYTEANSTLVKKATYSKPVLAFQFFLKVKNGDITLADFDETTTGKMKAIVDAITQRLRSKTKT